MGQTIKSRHLKNRSFAQVGKDLLPGAIFILFLSLLILAGIAWRQLDPSLAARLHQGVQQTRVAMVQASSVLAAEIAEQLRESDGIILVTLVIVLIIIGGTYGATRHMDQ